MSKVRKPCNRRAQIDRAQRALVRTNYAAVANVEPGDIQIMVNWKTCKQIRSAPVADSLCDLAHRWTVYIAVFCQEPSGAQPMLKLRWIGEEVQREEIAQEFKSVLDAQIGEAATLTLGVFDPK